MTAETCSNLVNLHYQTIKDIYQKVRQKIFAWQSKQGSLSGICEVDESYFGASRVRGKRGRGAGGKTIVFGILECEGKVFTQVVPNCQRRTL